GERAGLAQQASVEDLVTTTTLVHETVNRADEGRARFVELVRLRYGQAADAPAAPVEVGADDPILSRIGGHAVEVFAAGSPVVRTFLVRRHDTLIGVMINP